MQICQHHCPVSMWPRSSGVLRDRAAGHGRGARTHVQRLATIVNGDCACTTHVPLTR
ncbi:hypothetical protein I552_0024 [Mycobacterium xenopi 3993]|nr:hypothetical protein I552_0024 [Mycobacterium xenopi 3993]